MTFPTPYLSAGAVSGQWQVYSNTLTTTYPSGLQFGDLALLVQADSASQQFSYPTIATPTSSVMVANATATWTTSDPKSGDTIYSRTLAQVSARFVTSAQSGTSIGAFSSVQCVILRCNAFSSGNTTWTGMNADQGTSATYSKTVNYAISSAPTASIFVTCAANSSNGVNSFTHTFNGVAPANTVFRSATGSGSAARLSFNFQSNYPAANIAVVCSNTNGEASVHYPIYLGQT